MSYHRSLACVPNPYRWARCRSLNPSRIPVEAGDVCLTDRWTESKAQAVAPSQTDSALALPGSWQQSHPPCPLLAPARSARGRGGDPASTNPAVTRSPRRRAVSQDHAAGNGFHMHQGHKINCGETKGVKRGARESPEAARRPRADAGSSTRPFPMTGELRPQNSPETGLQWGSWQ